MSRFHVTALLALSALVFLTSTAFAQQGQRMGTRSNPGGVSEKDVPMCQASGGGTRTRANCKTESETTTLRVQQQVKVPIELHALLSTQCEAVATTEYQQRNTSARVSSTLAIASCAAAADGEFTFAVRVKDESGELKTLEFSETWQRSDDQDVKFSADYPIGEDTELVSVRVRNLHCTCADSPSEEAGPGQ